MPQRISEFKAGQPLREARLNRLVNAVNRAGAISAAAPLVLSQTESGLSLALADQPHFDLVRLSQHVLPGSTSNQATRLARDFSASPSAVDPFIESDESLGYVIDHMAGTYLAGSRLLALWLPGAAGRIMLPCINWHLARLDSSLSAGGSAAASLWGTDPAGTAIDTGLDVVAYDWLLGAGDSLPAGTNVVVFQHVQNARWYVVHTGVSSSPGVSPVRFRLTAPLALGGSAAAVMRAWSGASYVDGAPITVNDFSGETFEGQTGDEGMAVELADRPGVYEILWIERATAPAPAVLVRFELTAELSLGGSATAKQVAWDGAAYSVTGDPFTVRDFTSPGSWRGQAGYRGWALVMADRGDHEIIWMERLAERIEATLLSDMGDPTSGEASAAVNDYYRGRDPGSTVTVYDAQNQFLRAQAGAKLQATWNDRENRYEITRCQLPARHLRFTLDASLTTSSASQAATVRHSWDGMPLTAGSNVTVHNQPDDSAGGYLFSGDNGATGTATYDPENDKWWINWVECPAS